MSQESLLLKVAQKVSKILVLSSSIEEDARVYEQGKIGAGGITYTLSSGDKSTIKAAIKTKCDSLKTLIDEIEALVEGW